MFAAEDRDSNLDRSPSIQQFERWRSARDLYKRGYGLDRLRSLSAKRHAWDRNTDGWEGTKILFRELWRGQPNLALPALGGLFAPGQVRDFSDCQIANQFFYSAIFISLGSERRVVLSASTGATWRQKTRLASTKAS